MRFSQDFIEEVKNANDIIDVASGYINLKKKGRTYFGICPFHREKTPSFGINQDKQIYHCFGCNEGGTVIQLIQQLENLEFVEAIEFLANRVNIALPKVEYNQYDPKEKLRERCYLVNKEASKYFTASLGSSESQIARDYITKRKLNVEAIKEFGIGFSKSGIYDYLISKGFTEEEIFEVGLAFKRNDGRIIDRYINRLMFTIKDQKGRVIGFSGRTLINRDDIAKYINSNDNIVYNKGRNLFALDIAKKHSHEYMILVEGQMDAISLHQRGIKNVVAPLGTALTEAQARQISRFTKKVVFAYDSDNAGVKATLRGIEILKGVGLEVAVLILDNAKDPDEYIIKYGPELFKEKVKNAISVFEFVENNTRNNYDLSKIDQKTKYLNEIVMHLANVTNELERELYIDYVSKNAQIAKGSLEIELKKRLKGNVQIDSNNKNTTNSGNISSNISLNDFEENINKSKKEKREKNYNYENECHLIKKALENSRIINILEEKIGYDIIKDDINKEVFKLLFEINLKKKTEENINTNIQEIDILSLLEVRIEEVKDEELRKNIRNRIFEIIALDIENNDEVFFKLVRYYERLKIDEEIILITEALKDIQLEDADKLILMQNLNELIRKKKNIK